MCGRYSLSNPSKLTDPKRFAPGIVPFGVKPRFNIAPTQKVPVVLDTAPREIALARWGLIPHWAKDASIGNRMINARAETVAEKPAFRKLFSSKRCLVPADGFYEWKRIETRKVPYRMTLRSGELFCFAGLWDSWTDPSTGKPLASFTIITTSANDFMKPIHDRMPVILPENAEQKWLDDALKPEEAMKLLAPYPDGEMRADEVSLAVNSPLNDVPEVLLPAGHPVLMRKPSTGPDQA